MHDHTKPQNPFVLHTPICRSSSLHTYTALHYSTTCTQCTVSTVTLSIGFYSISCYLLFTYSISLRHNKIWQSEILCRLIVLSIKVTSIQLKLEKERLMFRLLCCGLSEEGYSIEVERLVFVFSTFCCIENTLMDITSSDTQQA